MSTGLARERAKIFFFYCYNYFYIFFQKKLKKIFPFPTLSSTHTHTHTHRGLCTILRSAAGGQDCVQDFDDDDYKNNSHWLSDGDNSNYVGYYDAASLYPSSGEFERLGISVRPD